MSWWEWQLDGAEGLPLRGVTDSPDGAARGVAIVAHGFTGNLRRNIMPVVSKALAGMGLVSHRFTMGHAGVGEDGDSIDNLDVFARDSLAHCMFDIRRVVDAVCAGELEGEGLPLILVGHSRGGAQVLGLAGRMCAAGDGPGAVVSIAATGTYTRFTDAIRDELDEKGYVERECGRATGGKVRLGRSWYAHHLDEPDRDQFTEDVGRVTCPALVCHARGDASVPFAHAERIVGLLGKTSIETCFLDEGDHNFDAHGVGDGSFGAGVAAVEALGKSVRGFLDRAL